MRLRLLVPKSVNGSCMKARMEGIINVEENRQAGENMGYSVIPEEKFICVWSDDVPEDVIEKYRALGYGVAYFIRGSQPVREALRPIILARC